MAKQHMTDEEIQSAVDSIFSIFHATNPLVLDALKVLMEAERQTRARIHRLAEKIRMSELDAGEES